MNITIVGAGRVGIHLAKYFSEENQDVFLVDSERSHLSVLESDFNLRTFQGQPLDLKTLREANTERADIFISVTADTATNLITCALAKSMGAKKTIARVDRYDFIDQKNSNVVKQMGVDHVVYPDYLSALSVISALEHSWSYGWNDFNDGSIIMVAVTVDSDSPITGCKLKEMYENNRTMHISALRRGAQTIIPHGEDTIYPGDILYITTVAEGIEKVKKISGKKDNPVKKVILLGGSNVAQIVTNLAGKRFSFVIIDKKIERCRELAERCRDAEIIFGDGIDQDVIEEAGINDADAFVALSDSSESNILSCLTAQDIGVGRTVAEIEKEQLIAKAESFNIGAIINKPIITANAIFQLILDSDYPSSKCFAMRDAEVARLEIKEGSILTKYPVKDLKLPKDLTFAGIIRNNRGEIVTGNSVFKPGDSVIVFCLNGALENVEKLFRK